MLPEEIPLCFECRGERLLGIVHRPPQYSNTGVLIIVGGPQYRVGSHRQFLLLARYLASHGIAVMRFDYRAMGDSEGEGIDFEHVNQDIANAIDSFTQQVPGVRNIVLWGLCDAASASLFYAYTDSRVTGLVLLNPWVRTVAGEAKAYLKHYYLARIVDKDFWRKVMSGKFNITASIKSLFKLTKDARSGSDVQVSEQTELPQSLSLPQRMLQTLHKFNGKILMILSGNDLTADEFRDLVKSSKEWQRELEVKQVKYKHLEHANHTFSSAEWRAQVESWTLEWITEM